MNNAELLTCIAGKVKALPGGKLRGPVVLYGSAKATDLVGDYFTPKTDFGVADRLPVHYQHGFDSVIKKRRLSVASLKDADEGEEAGLWAEYQLDLADKYQALLYEMAQAGKMGHSSGAVGHLVERKSVSGKVHEVTAWPLAELSLTPEPAEPRMVGQVIPAKVVEYTKSIFDDEAVRVQIDVNINHNNEGPAMEDHKTEGKPESQPSATNDIKTMLEGIAASISTTNERIDALEGQKAVPTAEEIAAVAEAQKAFEPQRSVYTPAAPNYVKTRGDNWPNAFSHWVRTGDASPIKHMQADTSEGWDGNSQFALSLKASNATSMLAGTDAAGGAAVPQGHVDTIVAKRDEMSLWRTLGVRQIPGNGLSVHLPIDNEDDGEFVSTAERASNDMDSPALDTKVFTLAKYTKRVPVTDELASDSQGLLTFLEDFVSRGQAKTMNSLLISAVGSSGTVFVSFASSIAIAFGELEDIMGDDDLANYLDATASTAWVTRASTYYGKIAQITSSNNRMYAETAANSSFTGPQILGSPVHFSPQVTAIGAQGNPNAKAIYFGNWNFVGVRVDPEMRVLRDPFSEASSGTVNLHYYFRTVFKCIQEEAIGYGVGLDV